jgi:hypothetical protein
MAKGIILPARTTADIDELIARVVDRLGNPEPPLDLKVVRASLKLDFGYYSAQDSGLLQETVARLQVAGKQVLLNPMLLVQAVRKLDLRALYLPDQRRILLDRDAPVLKHRWNEAHEVGHSLLPWHAGAMLGDDELSLIPTCHSALEAEANFAAAKLLFLRERFRADCRSLSPSFRSLEVLAERFGNTKSSTFWRCIEYWGEEVAMIGLITGHPHPAMRKSDFDPSAPCRHFIQSPGFAGMFSRTSETDVFEEIVGYCGRQRGGRLGTAEVLLTDDNGEAHRFMFESFCYHHCTLTLGIYLGPAARLFRAA